MLFKRFLGCKGIVIDQRMDCGQRWLDLFLNFPPGERLPGGLPHLREQVTRQGLPPLLALGGRNQAEIPV